MKIKFGSGISEFGPGVDIKLTGEELVTAISAYLVAHGIHVEGVCTITVNGKLCKRAEIYVDPSGSVIYDGIRYTGRGFKE